MSNVSEAEAAGGGLGLLGKRTGPLTVCLPPLQPFEEMREFLPMLDLIVVARLFSAEYTPGSGCCRVGVIAIVILRPLMLPCSTASAEPESRNSSSFLPTYGWTLNDSGPGAVANGFSSAAAEP